MGSVLQLALHLARHNSQDSALALDHSAQAAKLLVKVLAISYKAQVFALFGKGLFQTVAATFSCINHFVRSNLE
jgi:hypothetical protein